MVVLVAFEAAEQRRRGRKCRVSLFEGAARSEAERSPEFMTPAVRTEQRKEPPQAAVLL